MNCRSGDTRPGAGRGQPSARLLIDVTRELLGDINDSQFLPQ